MIFWEARAGGLILAVKAQPGARRARIGPVIEAAAAPGWPAARLRVCVGAPPEDGKANAAIITALAAWLQVKPALISQDAGFATRDKKFAIAGLRAEDLPKLE